jgi:hypothetical protein
MSRKKKRHPEEGMVKLICLVPTSMRELKAARRVIILARKKGQKWNTRYSNRCKRCNYELYRNTLTISGKG